MQNASLVNDDSNNGAVWVGQGATSWTLSRLLLLWRHPSWFVQHSWSHLRTRSDAIIATANDKTYGGEDVWHILARTATFCPECQASRFTVTLDPLNLQVQRVVVISVPVTALVVVCNRIGKAQYVSQLLSVRLSQYYFLLFVLLLLMIFAVFCISSVQLLLFPIPYCLKRARSLSVLRFLCQPAARPNLFRTVDYRRRIIALGRNKANR